MGYIARLFWVFVPCAIFFAACTKEIKIDASSDASLRKSLINMSRGMSENEIKDFNNAIYGIIALVTNDIPKSENRTDIAIKSNAQRQVCRRGIRAIRTPRTKRIKLCEREIVAAIFFI